MRYAFPAPTAQHSAHLAAYNAALFASGRTTGITFTETQDGTDASATYTRGDVEASLYVQPDQDGGMVFAVGLLDRRDSDYTLVIDFQTESLPDASRVLALAALMARAPETAAAWFEEQGMHVDTAPLLSCVDSLEALPARILASDEPAVVATEPEPEPAPAAPMHADGIPVVFDVVAPTHEAAGRALARWITRHAETFPVEVESWWFPEVEDRAVVPNDNDPMRLVADDVNRLDVVAALTDAIFALNTLGDPLASTSEDAAALDERAAATIATLDALRGLYRRA